MRDFLGHLCRLDAGTVSRALKTMAKALAVHATGFPNWWGQRISRGRMEGINNKIKAMSRQHYGLRDERFFILSLLGLHETKVKLSGC